ncbi:tryptophan-rich sensory protein [Flavobacteriaceae bacterium XHP0103]|uniref:TspO/MBR family protein n=1 Tax=Marixanthotalea marina TaxID=2844359 RepID=UPI002989EC46|nr:TspO/MBR family protein [Marixanthotalea marina]MBU3821576.1 tryptophan-rich sensory protein [Marixanthotalea marina]
MKTLQSVAIFLIINFGALALGAILMNNGPLTTWYFNLNKAPWTPPNWAFGFAWTVIMICYSVYMAHLYNLFPTVKTRVLYIAQLILNIGWSYVFFNKHLIGFGLIVICALTLVITLFILLYSKTLKSKTFLILPYFLWLCIAISLNAYIYFNN